MLLVFVYTTVANVIERPDGIKIASFFIVSIIVVSLASRVRRSLELSQERIEMDEKARRFIEEASYKGEIHIIANRRQPGRPEGVRQEARGAARVQPYPGGRAGPVSGDRRGRPLGVRGGCWR